MAREEWEKPEPTTAWRGAAGVAASFGGSAAIAAIVTAAGPSAGVPVLWALAALCGAVAVVCLLAHWDANRGRRPRRAEVVLEEMDPGATSAASAERRRGGSSRR